MADPSPPRPNMQQIADAANVSKSAVSLALRNDPRIPASTRTRIQKVAEEMGYRRNPVVDSLMAQLRAGRHPNFQANLGLINCSAERDLSKNHTFRRLREGVLRRAEQLGYGIEEFWLEQPDLRPHRLKQILETRGIPGLILIAALKPDMIHEGYTDFWDDFACAVLGVTHLDDHLDCATNDQYLTARRATEKVIEMGYSRPVLSVPPEDDALLDDKFSAGFLSATRHLPRASRLNPIDLDINRVERAVNAIRKVGPDVVLTNKTELFRALRETDLRIPEDIGVVHLDWHDGISELSGMRQNNRIVGSAGVDLVVGLLQKNETGPQMFPKVVQIESVWVEGETVRQKAAEQSSP